MLLVLAKLLVTPPSQKYPASKATTTRRKKPAQYHLIPISICKSNVQFSLQTPIIQDNIKNPSSKNFIYQRQDEYSSLISINPPTCPSTSTLLQEMEEISLVGLKVKDDCIKHHPNITSIEYTCQTG